MTKIACFLLILGSLFLLSCESKSTQNTAVVDSASDTLAEVVTGKISYVIDTDSVFKSCLHCLVPNEYSCNGALVAVRDSLFTDVPDFVLRTLRYWDANCGGGILIYLGTDSSDVTWTIEGCMTSSATGNIEIKLRARKGEHILKERTLTNLFNDFTRLTPEEVKPSKYIPLAVERLKIQDSIYHLGQLFSNADQIRIPNEKEADDAVSMGYEALKLTTINAAGEKKSWYLGYAEDMCWRSPYWAVVSSH